MSVKVTIVVHSDGHSGGTNTMEKTLERGSANQRYYPSEIQHAIVELCDWAAGGMMNLIGPKNALSDKGKLMVVDQREHLIALERASEFTNVKKGLTSHSLVSKKDLEACTQAVVDLRELEHGQGTRVIVTADELAALRRRDALLSAMETAGVDNWEGMDNVVRPED